MPEGTENTTYEAEYFVDRNGDGTDDEEQLITITFEAGEHGSFAEDEETSFRVLPGTDNYPTAPTTVDEDNWTFSNWDPNYTAGVLVPEGTEDTTYEAVMLSEANINVVHNKPDSTIVFNDEVINHSITITNSGDLAGYIDLSLLSNNVAGTIVPETGYENLTSANGIDNLKIDGNSSVTINYTLNISGVTYEAIMTTFKHTVSGENEQEEQTTYHLESPITYVAKNQSIKDANVVIAIDRSGSMTTTKFNEAKTAAISFINNMFANSANNKSTVTVYTFGYKCEFGDSIIADVLCTFTNLDSYAEKIGSKTYDVDNYSELTATINTLQADNGHWLYGNGTPYTEPLKAANETFTSLKNSNEDVLVFLSDGDPTDNEIDWEAQITAMGTSVNRYAVGYDVKAGTSTHNTLRNIASSDSQVFLADTSALNNAFTNILTSITNGEGITTNTVLGVANIGSILNISDETPVVIKYGTKSLEVTSLGTVVYEGEDGNYYIDIDELTDLSIGDSIVVEFFANVSN